MIGSFFLYISKRSQRIMAALLGIILIHILVASGAPRPVSALTYIQVEH